MIKKWQQQALESVKNRAKMRERRAGTQEGAGGSQQAPVQGAELRRGRRGQRGRADPGPGLSARTAALTSGQKRRPGLRRKEAGILVFSGAGERERISVMCVCVSGEREYLYCLCV